MKTKEAEEERANIKALKDLVSESAGKAMQCVFEAGYFHGIKTEKEQRLRGEEK